MDHGYGPRLDGGTNESPSGEINDVLRILSDPLCRFILRQLVADPSNTVTFSELVDSYAELVDKDQSTVEIECHHTHIPVLMNAGVIDYDEQSGEVRYYGDPLIEAVLDVVSQWEE